jgi:hypothetical protein
MENEKRQFYLIIGITLIVLGLFSFIYGYIIPTKNLPMVIGITILMFIRKKSTIYERKTTSKDVSPENQDEKS